MAFTENNFIEFAEIHKLRLKGLDFLSECSVKFISYFYKTVSYLPSVIIVTEFEEPQHKIAGFFFLTTNKNEFMKYFIKKNLFNILKSPSAYIPITKAILNKLFLSEKIHFNYKNEGVYLCTAPDALKGMGTRLMIRSEDEMKNAGFNIFYVAVFEKNAIALNFYNKFKFKTIAEYKTSRGKKFLMSKELI